MNILNELDTIQTTDDEMEDTILTAVIAFGALPDRRFRQPFGAVAWDSHDD